MALPLSKQPQWQHKARLEKFAKLQQELISIAPEIPPALLEQLAKAITPPPPQPKAPPDALPEPVRPPSQTGDISLLERVPKAARTPPRAPAT